MQIAGQSVPHFGVTSLLGNIDLEISKLDFCKITKVESKDVYQAHCLAKRALISSAAIGDIPFWTGSTAVGVTILAS